MMTQRTAPPAPVADTEWLMRFAVRTAAVGVLFNVVFILSSQSWRQGLWVTPVTITLLTLAAAAGVVIIGQAQMGSSNPVALWALLVVGTMLVVSGALAAEEADRSVGFPWLLHPAVVVAYLAPALMSRALAAAFGTVILAVVGMVRSQQVTALELLTELGTLWLGMIAIGTILAAFRVRFQEVADADAQSERIRQATILQDVRTAQREWWDRIIHDKILGALALGSGADSTSARVAGRTLAIDALSAMQHDPPERGHTWESVRTFGQGVGLDVRLQITTRAPGAPQQVRRTFLRATEEALLNVAKHSGVNQVTVTVRDAPGECVVDVTDRGCGFNTEGPPSDRFGLRESIPGHVASVGGKHVIRSAAGRGTVVSLRWPAYEPSDVASRWSVGGDRLPHLWLPVTWLTVFAMQGWVHRYAVSLPVPMIVGAVLLTITTVLAFHRAHHPTLVVAGQLASMLLFTTSTTFAEHVDSRLWFVGGSVPVLFLLAIHGRKLPAAIACIGSFLIVLGGAALSDVRYAPAAIEGSLQLLFVTATGTLLSIAFDRAEADIKEAREREYQARVDAEVAVARAAETERRRATLEASTRPLLEHLSGPADLTAADRQRCAAVEAETRDLLLAQPLLTSRLVRALRRARLAGAQVTLTSNERTESTHPELKDTFVETLAAVLDWSGQDTVITARWQPENPGWAATINASGLVIPRGGPDELSAIDDDGGIQVEVDGDECWVEFAPIVPSASTSTLQSTSGSFQHRAGGPA